MDDIEGDGAAVAAAFVNAERARCVIDEDREMEFGPQCALRAARPSRVISYQHSTSVSPMCVESTTTRGTFSVRTSRNTLVFGTSSKRCCTVGDMRMSSERCFPCASGVLDGPGSALSKGLWSIVALTATIGRIHDLSASNDRRRARR
jgi:hypothetical protein